MGKNTKVRLSAFTAHNCSKASWYFSDIRSFDCHVVYLCARAAHCTR